MQNSLFLRKYILKDVNLLIQISKDEAEYLRSNGLWYDVHMSSRNKKSKGKRYYMTTSPKASKLLDKYRSTSIVIDQ